MNRLLVCFLASGVACGACQKPGPRLSAPPHDQAESRSELQDAFAYMVDNGLLADMTISDAHFLPHRPALNPLGQERLRRLTSILQMYGGAIRFDTRETDATLIERRIDVLKAALAAEGIDTAAEVVKPDSPGGRGMDAAQAVLIKSVEGTYVPKEKSGADATKPDILGATDKK